MAVVKQDLKNSFANLSLPSSSVARFTFDEPVLAWIMTHEHSKDLCVSELCPPNI